MAAVLGAAPLPSLVQDETGSAERDVKLPSGKSQREEILKADHEKDLKALGTDPGQIPRSHGRLYALV